MRLMYVRYVENGGGSEGEILSHAEVNGVVRF